jgi:hypothetical protein
MLVKRTGFPANGHKLDLIVRHHSGHLPTGEHVVQVSLGQIANRLQSEREVALGRVPSVRHFAQFYPKSLLSKLARIEA